MTLLTKPYMIAFASMGRKFWRQLIRSYLIKNYRYVLMDLRADKVINDA